MLIYLRPAKKGYFHMYTVHFCANVKSEHGLYNYQAAGSKSQVIEGARIKSNQVPMLVYREWLVLFKQNNITQFTRSMKNGNII